ncbi:MAG: hypothetical protein WDN50_04670 [Bradyrhizobium sp.]
MDTLGRFSMDADHRRPSADEIVLNIKQFTGKRYRGRRGWDRRAIPNDKGLQNMCRWKNSGSAKAAAVLSRIGDHFIGHLS